MTNAQPFNDVSLSLNDFNQVSVTIEREKSSPRSLWYAKIREICTADKKADLFRGLKRLMKIVLILLYVIYFIAVLWIPSKREEVDYWCDADGILIIITSIFAVGLLYFKIFKPALGSKLKKGVEPIHFKINSLWNQKRWLRIFTYVGLTLIYALLIIYDTFGSPTRLKSGFGILFFLALGSSISHAPSQIRVRHIFWGLGLQFALGICILRWRVGKAAFECAGSKFSDFLSYTDVGTSFALGKFLDGVSSYAFKILPIILFFSMFVSILYYHGILQFVIMKLGWILEVTMGTTPCESMSAASNIFFGQAEAPLVIRPYLPELTKSELHAVLTGGFSTIAGSILAAYISFGISASHLLTASVMSAPAALLMSKLIYPETQKSKTAFGNIKLHKGEEKTLIHAVANGLLAGIPLIAVITVNMIGFVAMMAFANGIVDWGCQLVNVEAGVCSMQGAFGYLLYPIAWGMGVPPEDCFKVGYLLATKYISNDFIAYTNMMGMVGEGNLTERASIIATYALCGFSSIATMGSALGSLGSMAPSRRKDISQIVFRALVAGNCASYLTACVAGVLTEDASVNQNYYATVENITTI